MTYKNDRPPLHCHQLTCPNSNISCPTTGSRLRACLPRISLVVHSALGNSTGRRDPGPGLVSLASLDRIQTCTLGALELSQSGPTTCCEIFCGAGRQTTDHKPVRHLICCDSNHRHVPDWQCSRRSQTHYRACLVDDVQVREALCIGILVPMYCMQVSTAICWENIPTPEFWQN